MDREAEDTTTYKVIVNEEEQYAIWPEFKEIPTGWKYADKTDAKADCLAYIREVWVDMRPLTVRQKMDQQRTSSSPVVEINQVEPPTLVDRLCEGMHTVQIKLRPEMTVQRFKESLNRDHIPVKFTGTNGGSEFGIKLDKAACDFSNVDLDNGWGTAHLEGRLSVDFVPVKCVVDIDLPSFEGSGRLVRV
jgi:uncharacterized protein YbdZ (MbtH family)